MKKTNGNMLFLAAEKLGIHVVYRQGPFQILEYKGITHSFFSGIPDTTSSVANKVCTNKFITNSFLEEKEFPVLPSILFKDNGSANSFLLDYKTIVVKPIDGAMGEGISINIKTKDALSNAIEYAKPFSKKGQVLLQKQAKGVDHRVLVIGKKIVRVMEKKTPIITGNGKDSLESLILQENTRRTQQFNVPEKIVFSNHIERELKKKNVYKTTILENGKTLVWDMSLGMSQGRISEDKTNVVSEKVRKTAIAIAQEMNLDWVGIDMMSTDISKDIVDFSIIELNSNPDIAWHLTPDIGEPRDVASDLLQHLFKIN